MRIEKEKEKKTVKGIFITIGVWVLIIFLIFFIFKRDIPFWPLWIGVVLLVVGVLLSQDNNIKKQKSDFKKQGIDINKFIYAGKYISGHIKIDKPQEKCSLYVKEDIVKIYTVNKSTLTNVFLANIEKQKIKKISLEDQTSIQKRVGLKRMLAIGIFAFAVKKKVKEELSYIIIEWSDGKFDHETVFEFEGKGSVTQANELRNKLINEIG